MRCSFFFFQVQTRHVKEAFRLLNKSIIRVEQPDIHLEEEQAQEEMELDENTGQLKFNTDLKRIIFFFFSNVRAATLLRKFRGFYFGLLTWTFSQDQNFPPLIKFRRLKKKKQWFQSRMRFSPAGLNGFRELSENCQKGVIMNLNGP